MTITDVLLQWVYGFVITAGFAILFNVPRRFLIGCGIVGAFGHLLRFTLRSVGISNEVATFAGALLVGQAGYLQARRFHMPRLAFTITGIISMIPGVAAYEMVVYLSNNKLTEGLQSGVRVALAVGAITAGLSMARILTEIEFRKPGETKTDQPAIEAE